MTKILITGATGFVGKQVATALIDRGAEVTSIVRKKDFHLNGLKNNIFVPDVFKKDESYWKTTCKNFDILVNVAWHAEPGKYLTSEKNLTCLSGTLAMAQGAVQAGIRKFVGIGTCFEYDLSISGSNSFEPLSPHSKLGPKTTYGAAKASAWLVLSEFMKECTTEFAWCRLFYLFGEGEDKRRLVPYLRDKLSKGVPVDLTSGTQTRDFMNVSDAGKLIGEVALGPYKGALNICSGKPITVASFAKKIAEEYGRPDLLRFGVRPENLLDPPYVVGVPSLKI